MKQSQLNSHCQDFMIFMIRSNIDILTLSTTVGMLAKQLQMYIFLTVYSKCTHQNLHWKLGQQTPSDGTLLASLETKAWIIFFFVFQDRELKFSASVWKIISRNLTKYQIVWMRWYFVRCHKIHFQTDAESFSFLSWETKKFYF